MGILRCQQHALQVQWLEKFHDPVNEIDTDTLPPYLGSHKYIAKPGKSDPIRDYTCVSDLPARACLVDAEISGTLDRSFPVESL